MVFTGAGRPLEPTEFASPMPTGGEILVRVTCCTLCRSDLHTHAGRRIEPMPTVPGHEIVGRIEAFGPDSPRRDALGEALEVGTRVTWAVNVGCGACFFCRHDLPQKCERPHKYGHHRNSADRPLGGGLAETILLAERTFVVRVPDEIPDRVAAPANCATATAAALLRYGGPISGGTVLILGAGVLGLTACAMARVGGAEAVVVCDPLESGRLRAEAFGATHTCPPDALADALRDATHGRGADVVLELAGHADAARSAIASARVGGTVVLAGTVSPVGTIGLDPEAVVRRMLTIRGVHNYHPSDLVAAIRFLAGQGRAFPFAELVAATYPLERADDAFADAHARPGVRVAVIPGESR